jgi:predicted SnoaL-like aldol condensation-catalyzing enzyme
MLSFRWLAKVHRALGFDMFRVQDGKIAEHWDAD